MAGQLRAAGRRVTGRLYAAGRRVAGRLYAVGRRVVVGRHDGDETAQDGMERLRALGRRVAAGRLSVLGWRVLEKQSHVPVHRVAEEGLYALRRCAGMVTTERLRVPGRRVMVRWHDGKQGGATMVARV